MPIPRPIPNRVRWAGLLLLSATVACNDGSLTSSPPSSVPDKSGSTGYTAYQATVDAAKGTLTITPLNQTVSGTGSQITRAVYGTQGVNVRFYSGTTAIDSVSNPPNRSYTFTVGFQNLLTHPIGVIQNATSTRDTIGVYAFFPNPVTINSPQPCGGCTVTLDLTQGALPINSVTPQLYYYWGERVSAVGSTNPRPDTTLSRRTWVFRTTGPVQNFTYTFLLSAPFPPPSETRWKVDYEADSLPDTQSEPKWKNSNSAGFVFTGNSAGTVVLGSNNNASNRWQRNDSLPSNGQSYIQARLQIVAGTGNTRIAGLRLVDGVRYCALGVGNGQAGIMNGTNNNYQGGTTFNLTTLNTYHVYQLSKYAQDSVVMFIDGVRRAKSNYNAACTADVGQYEMWGSFGVNQFTVSQWDYVIYEIGVATPAG